jgi:hypothetical protein
LDEIQTKLVNNLTFRKHEIQTSNVSNFWQFKNLSVQKYGFCSKFGKVMFGNLEFGNLEKNVALIWQPCIAPYHASPGSRQRKVPSDWERGRRMGRPDRCHPAHQSCPLFTLL